MFVISGIKKVTATPNIATIDIIPMVKCMPYLCKNNGKVKAPANAPILPTAAEIPCAFALIEDGYISDGIRKVVVLGPKLTKKKLMKYARIIGISMGLPLEA